MKKTKRFGTPSGNFFDEHFKNHTSSKTVQSEKHDKGTDCIN